MYFLVKDNDNEKCYVHVGSRIYEKSLHLPLNFAASLKLLLKYVIKITVGEFSLWLSRLQTHLVSMRMWVQSLALLSGLRIQHCNVLWYRLWTWLRSWVAVAVAAAAPIWSLASSCSSCLTPSPGTSICQRRCSEKKITMTLKKNCNEPNWYIWWNDALEACPSPLI